MRVAAADLEAFDGHGFFVVRGLFVDDEIATVRAAFDRLWQQAQHLKTTTTVSDALFVLAARAHDVVVQRIVWAGGAEPVLLSLGHDARLVELALELLGTTTCDHLLNQAHFKMPGDGVAFDWHQDIQHRDKGGDTWHDVNGRGSYVQTLLLVDDMTLDNGPLQFLPDDAVSLDERGRLQSRHDDYHEAAPSLHGAFAVDVAGTTVLPTAAIEPDPRRAITVTGKAGDVVVFGPYAVHGSTPNRSRAPRRVLINGYAAPGANGRRYPGSGLGLRLPR